MNMTEHPIRVLCDAHVIPMLMFLRENGPAHKTDIYRAVGRSANMPAKIQRMEDSGLVTIDKVTISEIVGLTDLGRSVTDILSKIDSKMATQTP